MIELFRGYFIMRNNSFRLLYLVVECFTPFDMEKYFPIGAFTADCPFIHHIFTIPKLLIWPL